MATIHNDMDYTFSPSEQQEIQKAAAWQAGEWLVNYHQEKL